MRDKIRNATTYVRTNKTDIAVNALATLMFTSMTAMMLLGTANTLEQYRISRQTRKSMD